MELDKPVPPSLIVLTIGILIGVSLILYFWLKNLK